MKKIKLRDVTRYVEENIGTFHQQRIASIDALKLSQVLKRKNPYLFKAKHMLTAEQIVKGLVDAHISSNEETIFGDWLEGRGRAKHKKGFRRGKSRISRPQLPLDNNKVRYIVN